MTIFVIEEVRFGDGASLSEAVMHVYVGYTADFTRAEALLEERVDVPRKFRTVHLRQMRRYRVSQVEEFKA